MKKGPPFASRINTLPPTLGGTTPEQVQSIFPPQPFGCEFTFIDPGRPPAKWLPQLPKGLKELLRWNYPNWTDDNGALEIRSPVFRSYGDAIAYWSELRAALAPFGLVPWNWDDPNGGLHVRINIPRELFSRAGRVLAFAFFASYPLTKLAEVGDLYSSLDFGSVVMFEQEFKATDKQLFQLLERNYSLVERNKTPGLILDDESRFRPPTIEHRYFDSPASPSELLLFLYVAQRVHQLGLGRRVYYTVSWDDLMGPISVPFPQDRSAAHWHEGWEKVTNAADPYMMAFDVRSDR